MSLVLWGLFPYSCLGRLFELRYRLYVGFCIFLSGVFAYTGAIARLPLFGMSLEKGHRPDDSFLVFSLGVVSSISSSAWFPLPHLSCTHDPRILTHYSLVLPPISCFIDIQRQRFHSRTHELNGLSTTGSSIYLHPTTSPSLR